MKEPGIKHWSDPNTDATNESGFSALPGGSRRYMIYGRDTLTFFSELGSGSYFYSSTTSDLVGLIFIIIILSITVIAYAVLKVMGNPLLRQERIMLKQRQQTGRVLYGGMVDRKFQLVVFAGVLQKILPQGIQRQQTEPVWALIAVIFPACHLIQFII